MARFHPLAAFLVGASFMFSGDPASGRAETAVPKPPAPTYQGVDTDIGDRAMVLLRQYMRGRSSIADIRAFAMSDFEREDIDGGGIGASDQELADQLSAARNRATRLSDIFSHDLDGDGAVTMDELRRALLPQARQPLRSAAGPTTPTAEQIAKTLEKLIAEKELPDSDGDGRATTPEIMTDVARRSSSGTAGGSGRIGGRFDLDGDGTTTRAEFEAALDAVLAVLDADSDGSVSVRDQMAFNEACSAVEERVSKARLEESARAAGRQKAVGCPFPRAPEGAQVVYLGLHKSPTLSTLTLSRRTQPTYLTDVVIDEGERPIYLLTAAFGPMILRLSGAVGRLAHIASVSERELGVVGVPRDRFSWASDRQCKMGGWDSRDQTSQWVFSQGFLEAVAGRTVDIAISEDSPGMIALPSGDLAEREPILGQIEVPEVPYGPIWRRYSYFTPQGMVAVTADEVIAPTPAVPYELPGPWKNLGRL